MALLDEMRTAVRVSHSATDDEIQMWIDAAVDDMRRVGISEGHLGESDGNGMSPLCKAAVACYVKANYGFDVAERPQFEDSYRRIVVGLMNSDANVASGETR